MHIAQWSWLKSLGKSRSSCHLATTHTGLIKFNVFCDLFKTIQQKCGLFTQVLYQLVCLMVRCLLGVTNCQSIQLKLLFIYCRNKDYSLLKYYTFSCRIVGQFMFGLHLSFVHFTFKKPVIHRIWYPYSWRALGNCKCTRDFKRGQAIKVDAAADTVEHLEREDGMQTLHSWTPPAPPPTF